MSRHIDDFTEEEVLKVIKAYLIEGLSHRKIQWEILGIPAPDKGGGYVAMDILHYFDIKGDKKGILQNADIDEFIYNATDKFLEILIKLKAYMDEEIEIEKTIKGLSPWKYDNSRNTEISRQTKQRVGQDKLREYILKIYNNQCALCEINKDDLLLCSHIIPWNMDEENRLNPQNAICLCSLHDKLFDRRYFSLDENYEIIFTLKADDMVKRLLNGLKFREPLQDSPDNKFLKKHYNI